MAWFSCINYTCSRFNEVQNDSFVYIFVDNLDFVYNDFMWSYFYTCNLQNKLELAGRNVISYIIIMLFLYYHKIG